MSADEVNPALTIKWSFYEPFPEIAGKLRIGFSSTALHWLNAKTVEPDYFQHPLCVQPNQLPDLERRKYVEKLKADWRAFLHECSTSPGYYSLRDICQELC